VLSFDTEDSALTSAENMLSNGHMASIDSVDPYCYLQGKIMKTLPEICQGSIINRLLFDKYAAKTSGGKGSNYSQNELLNIFLQMDP
jgi:hypothetical protein